MSLERRVHRRQKRDAKKLIASVKTAEGQHVLGSSHVEVLAALREIPRPASHDLDVDPNQARKDRNKRKAARKATR